LAEGLLATGAVPGLEADWELRREVRHGSSRIDFLLQRGASRLWVEVKSVTLVDGGLGLFPDAPTRRGRRHVSELAALARKGDSAMLLFVVQRGDATAVAPHSLIDPAFADALADAEKAGVDLRAAGFRFDARGRVTGCHTLPVLTPRD
jgi:sugar fermentation stimulation protein A